MLILTETRAIKELNGITYARYEIRVSRNSNLIAVLIFYGWKPALEEPVGNAHVFHLPFVHTR